MTDLKDLKKRRDTFDIDGQKLDLVALSIDQILSLFDRFEKLADIQTMPLIQVLRAAGKDACGAVIAAAIGKPNDQESEKLAAENISFGDQVDIIDIVIKISQPKGDGPLAQGLAELAGLFRAIATARAAIAEASPISSPLPSPNSHVNGADQTTSGN